MAGTTRILLARHGQTEWNLEYKFQGKTNTKLTDIGKSQAQALADRLASWPFEIIYSSPLDRAMYTSQVIARARNIDVIALPELQEINFGTWEGHSIKALQTEQRELFSKWRADPFFNMPPGAETWEKLYNRLSRAVKTILDGQQKNIIVISHGGIMRALYSVLLGFNPHKVWNNEISNCGMSGIEMRSGRPWLIFANDDLHIRAGEAGKNLPVWNE